MTLAVGDKAADVEKRMCRKDGKTIDVEMKWWKSARDIRRVCEV